MAQMTDTDRAFKNAVSRFVSDYNYQINALRKELEKERKKNQKLEEIVRGETKDE